MIDRKSLREYIRITEDWLFYNKNIELLDSGFIYYREGNRLKVSLCTIDNVNGQTGGGVLYVKYLDYQLEVRRLKINNILKR